MGFTLDWRKALKVLGILCAVTGCTPKGGGSGSVSQGSGGTAPASIATDKIIGTARGPGSGMGAAKTDVGSATSSTGAAAGNASAADVKTAMGYRMAENAPKSADSSAVVRKELPYAPNGYPYCTNGSNTGGGFGWDLSVDDAHGSHTCVVR